MPNSGAPSILNKSYTITAEVTVPKGGGEGVIVTDGGRFGGYALFLSPAFNWWSRADLFRNLGLGFLVFGLLLVWRGQIASWSRLKMRASYTVATLAALLLVAVGTTRIVGVGRGKPVFLYNLLDLKRTTWAGPALGAGKHTIVFEFKSAEPGLGKGGTGVLSVDGKEVARNSMENSTPITFPEDESFDVGPRHPHRRGAAGVSLRFSVPVHGHGRQAHLRPRTGAADGRGAQAASGHRRRGRPREGLAGRAGRDRQRMRKLLILMAVSEGLTGLIALVSPAIVTRLLFGAEIAGAGVFTSSAGRYQPDRVGSGVLAGPRHAPGVPRDADLQPARNAVSRLRGDERRSGDPAVASRRRPRSVVRPSRSDLAEGTKSSGGST